MNHEITVKEITVKLIGPVLRELTAAANKKNISVEYLVARILSAWVVQQIVLGIEPEEQEKTS